MQSTVVNDPLYGPIDVEDRLFPFINTTEFQRLHHIKQLGFVFEVYPGASHSRYEHSLGTMHLASELLKRLKEVGPHFGNLELGELSRMIEGTEDFGDITEAKIYLRKQIFDEQDMFCVKVAALLHDLGHGPFSHVWEQFLNDLKKEGNRAASQAEFIHEEMSIKLIDCIVQNNSTIKDEVFKGYDFEDDMKFIKELILPERRQKTVTRSKRSQNPLKNFYYEIVSNKLNENDVDKWDYLARDSYHVGLNTSFDVRRLLKTCQVGFDKMGKTHIMWLEKDLDTILQIFEQRKRLHKKVSRHKSAKLVEECYKEMFAHAASQLYIVSDINKNKRLPFLRAHEDPYLFMNMTDGILHMIQAKFSVTHPSKSALQRIHCRDFKQLTYIHQATLADNDLDHLHNQCKSLKTKFDTELSKKGVSTENRRLIKICEVGLDFGKKKGKKGHPIENTYLHVPGGDYAVSAAEFDVKLIKHYSPVKMFEQIIIVYCYNTVTEKHDKDTIKNLFIQSCEYINDSIYKSTQSAIYFSHVGASASQLESDGVNSQEDASTSRRKRPNDNQQADAELSTPGKKRPTFPIIKVRTFQPIVCLFLSFLFENTSRNSHELKT